MLMKKLATSILLFAVSMWAADFWLSKPYTEWSDKDVDKMLHNSPWAKPVGISMGSSMPSGGGRGQRGKGGGSMGDTGGAGGGALSAPNGPRGGGRPPGR